MLSDVFLYGIGRWMTSEVTCLTWDMNWHVMLCNANCGYWDGCVFSFSSIIRTALYDEVLGGDLGHGQRGWLLHKPGHEPGASLILRESAEQSVRECRGFVLQQEPQKISYMQWGPWCSPSGVIFKPPECCGQMKTRILMWAINLWKCC